MRDLLANLIARLRATNRQQRLYLALGVVGAFVLLRFGAGWFLEYRREIKEDIRLSAQRIANARVTLERASETERHLADLKNRYRATLARLVPGDTPTLAAAALQDKVSNLAAQNNVRIQTTQVLKDEAVETFRQVSLRITASGDLKDLAAFLYGLEFGPLQVQVSFIELTRRGAAIRRRPGQDEGPRSVSATVQIAGIVQGSADEGADVRPVAADLPATAGEPAAPAGDASAPAASAPIAAPVAPAPPEPGRPAPGVPEPGVPAPGLPAPGEPLPGIPEDALGTAGQVTPQ
jgi:hypothetical protein